MSCNLTAITIEIPKLIRIHIRTRNKINAKFKKRLYLLLLFLQKMLIKTDKWLIFVN